jgi:hypothetical protein
VIGMGGTAIEKGIASEFLGNWPGFLSWDAWRTGGLNRHRQPDRRMLDDEPHRRL